MGDVDHFRPSSHSSSHPRRHVHLHSPLPLLLPPSVEAPSRYYIFVYSYSRIFSAFRPSLSRRENRAVQRGRWLTRGGRPQRRCGSVRAPRSSFPSFPLTFLQRRLHQSGVNQASPVGRLSHSSSGSCSTGSFMLMRVSRRLDDPSLRNLDKTTVTDVRSRMGGTVRNVKSVTGGRQRRRIDGQYIPQARIISFLFPPSSPRPSSIAVSAAPSSLITQGVISPLTITFVCTHTHVPC